MYTTAKPAQALYSTKLLTLYIYNKPAVGTAGPLVYWKNQEPNDTEPCIKLMWPGKEQKKV